MKTAIIYASKHGTTEKVARAIAEKLRETANVELFSLKQNFRPNIREFDEIILGSSIYMGQSSKKNRTQGEMCTKKWRLCGKIKKVM
jgi:menaquinone-dependent protoporphyrinogen oxidase